MKETRREEPETSETEGRWSEAKEGEEKERGEEEETPPLEDEEKDTNAQNTLEDADQTQLSVWRHLDGVKESRERNVKPPHAGHCFTSSTRWKHEALL